MKRKIVIEKCSDCPYVDNVWGLTIELTKDWKDSQLFCNHVLNGNAPEMIETKNIPDWCLLEKEGE